MLNESLIKLTVTIMAVAFGYFAFPVFAEAGHCDYRLYSKATNHAIHVCQTADHPAQCGRLLRRDYDRTRAHAVREKGRKLEFVEGSCSLEALVGICTLPHSKIFFYEGDTEELAIGCDRMKGHWNVMRL